MIDKHLAFRYVWPLKAAARRAARDIANSAVTLTLACAAETSLDGRRLAERLLKRCTVCVLAAYWD